MGKTVFFNSDEMLHGLDKNLRFVFLEQKARDAECDSFNERKRQALLRLIEKAAATNFTARQREIFDMRFKQGMTQQQIASALNINPSTVSRTLRKAETLIERLQNGCEELKKNPEQFKIFEVFDDTVENARSFLETLLSNCIRYPTAYIRVYY